MTEFDEILVNCKLIYFSKNWFYRSPFLWFVIDHLIKLKKKDDVTSVVGVSLWPGWVDSLFHLLLTAFMASSVKHENRFFHSFSSLLQKNCENHFYLFYFYFFRKIIFFFLRFLAIFPPLLSVSTFSLCLQSSVIILHFASLSLFLFSRTLQRIVPFPEY